MAADLVDNQGLARTVPLLASTVVAGAASVSATAVAGLAGYLRGLFVLDVTAAGTDSNDTLDVYVDVSLDGVTWLNALHFTQVLGNGGATKRYAVLNHAAAAGTSDAAVATDASSGAVRPYLWGAQYRARYVVVDPTGANAGFTFSVTALFQR